MNNVTSAKKDAISNINWESLELSWGIRYEEDYVTTLTSKGLYWVK